jgi:hypothetical protein
MVSRDEEAAAAAREIGGPNGADADRPELAILPDAESHFAARLESTHLAHQALHPCISDPIVADVLAAYTQVDTVDFSDAVPLDDASASRGSGVIHADDEDAKSVADTPRGPETDPEGCTVIGVGTRASQATIERVRVGRPNAYAAGATAAIYAKVDFLPRFDSVQLASKAPRHEAAHLAVVDVCRRQAQVHVVDRLDAISLLEPSTFGRPIRGDRGDENAECVAGATAAGGDTEDGARSVERVEHCAERAVVALALRVSGVD